MKGIATRVQAISSAYEAQRRLIGAALSLAMWKRIGDRVWTRAGIVRVRIEHVVTPEQPR